MSFAIHAVDVPVEGFAQAARALLAEQAAQVEADEVEQAKARLLQVAMLKSGGAIPADLLEQARVLEVVARRRASEAETAKRAAAIAREHAAAEPESAAQARAVAQLEATAEVCVEAAAESAKRTNDARRRAADVIPAELLAHIAEHVKAHVETGIAMLDAAVKAGRAGKATRVRIQIAGHVGDTDVENFAVHLWPMG